MKVTIEFPNQVTAEAFVGWMSGSGEQDAEEWFIYRNEENPEVVAKLRFNYGFPAWSDSDRYTGDLMRIVAEAIDPLPDCTDATHRPDEKGEGVEG